MEEYTDRQKQDIGRMLGVYREVLIRLNDYDKQPCPENSLRLIEGIDDFFKKIPTDIRRYIVGACEDESWTDLRKRVQEKIQE